VRLSSWNIQWGRGRDGRVDLARTVAQARRQRPDILCLQEVAMFHPGLPGGADEDQPARLAGFFPGFECVYGAASDLPDGRGGRRCFGNLILSRFPLLQVFRHSLPWPADPAVPSMPRAVLEAVVAAPGGPLRVLTTHLEYYSAIQRAAQVEALRNLLAEGHGHATAPRSAAETDPPFAVLPRGAAAILCGDFNVAAGSADYRRLLDPFGAGVPSMHDAWIAAHPGQPHAPTAGLVAVPWLARPDCYDFVFVDASLRGRIRGMDVDAECDASDHQPVTLELDDA